MALTNKHKVEKRQYMIEKATIQRCCIGKSHIHKMEKETKPIHKELLKVNEQEMFSLFCN